MLDFAFVMSECIDYSHLPEAAPHTELVALVGDQQSIPHQEPKELSPLGGAVLIGIGVVAVGVLTWMNEHKSTFHSRLSDQEQSEDREEAR